MSDLNLLIMPKRFAEIMYWLCNLSTSSWKVYAEKQRVSEIQNMADGG